MTTPAASPEPPTLAEDRSLAAPEVVIIFLVVAVFAGVIFLTSPPPNITPDGAIPWSQGSVLKALTTALAFEFKIPTPLGAAVKGLVGGVGTAVAIAAVALAMFLRVRDRVRETVWDETPQAPPPQGKKHIDPQWAAELLAIGVVVISFAGCPLAVDPMSAVGGSVLFGTYILWAVALRHGLRARSAAACAAGLCVVLVLCAALGIWYYYGRNPNQRLGYPVGNPLFLSACLIPGLLIIVTWMVRQLAALRATPGRAALNLVVGALGAGIIVWAMVLTQARGTAIGLAAGVFAGVFVALRGRGARIAVVALGAVAAIIGYVTVLGPLLSARSDTVRARLYTWDYALQLTSDAPILGHGQGGYAWLADARAAQNVLDDPWALKDRLAHAHNEWLETLADLGSFGLVAIGGALCLTFLAGIRACDACRDPDRRWLLIGLLAALAAMITEECTNVALRIAGFPTVFYGVVGLVWAMAAPPPGPPRVRTMTLPACGLLAGLALSLALGAAHLWDFRAARALYDYREKLEQLHFDTGLADIDMAARYRLSPQRRLSAELARGGAHLFVSGRAFENLMRLREEIRAQPQARNAARETAARGYFDQALLHARMAIDGTTALTARIGPSIDAHLIVGDAHDIVVRCARMTSNEAFAEQNRAAAVQAYALEHSRQPHDRDILWRLIEVSDDVPPEELIDFMAPVMRFLDVDDRYLGLVDQLARQPGFDDMLAPRVAGALAAVTDQPTEAGYHCENLRIGAWVASFRRRYDNAVTLGHAAVELADRQVEFFPMTPSICRRELAHYLFLADPQAVEPAIMVATTALERLPGSFEAVPLRRQIEQRLAILLLARGDEGDEARAALLADSGTGPEQLAALYHILCAEVVQYIDPAQWPPTLRERIQRFSELDPENPTPHLLAARVDFEHGAAARGLAELQAARDLDADPQLLSTSANWLLERYPEDEGLKGFVAEIANAATESAVEP